MRDYLDPRAEQPVAVPEPTEKESDDNGRLSE